ncbi:MAG: selenocysteine-specific translation elongation factor, partial [Chloroflexota bacterium]|nr:selenocysteine-specific translation elongation factor [Chloroflexota bacterium]
MSGLRVVATAGHVDHGKSTLITALTGMDPDRLREERERGMTIDLGFAWARLPGGADVGIVDVPGHQDFIRNMLAGVGAIDAVVLVVAADEGVMPQTREHLAILSLLGIERGVVVLTKRDLVDDEWAALVGGEVRETLSSSPLAAAPLVEVSSRDRRGLDELPIVLERVLGEAPPRRDIGRPRMAIDRAFTMSGFGTVVTGTLIDGSLAVGDEVAVVPGDRRARIRGLQTHRRSIDVAVPGSRVAVNLSGVDKNEVGRGMVLSRPEQLRPTSLIGMRVRILPAASDAIRQDETVKVHTGTAEMMARVSLLESGAIPPGADGWIQLRLAAPLAATITDRVVIRRPSPSETLGGGAIADVSAERVRRRSAAVAALERRTAPSPDARLIASLDVPRTPAEAGERSGLGSAEYLEALAKLVNAGAAVTLADAAVSAGAFEAIAVRVERTIAMVHRRAPLRSGAPREEIRGAVGLPAKRFGALVARLVAAGRVAERGSMLALPAHRSAIDEQMERRWEEARAALARDPLQPPTAAVLESEHGVDRELVAALAERGDLVRIGTDAVFLPEAVFEFGSKVIDELAASRSITVARARDLTGSSRKHVLPLLSFLDDHGL